MRRLRLAAGLTQERLSEAAHLDAAEISRLERGGRDPQLHTIVRVARGLGVSPADLLAGVEQRPRRARGPPSRAHRPARARPEAQAHARAGPGSPGAGSK